MAILGNGAISDWYRPNTLEFTLDWHDDASSCARTVQVKRPGRPPFQFQISLEDQGFYSDPLRAMYGMARREIEARQQFRTIPDRRHEARNFG